MADKNTQKPAGANKYSLYAGREEAVNWGKIAADLTGNLNRIKTSRDAAKKEINENTDKALTELSEIADVQSGDMNGLLIDGSDFSKNTLTANMDLVRRGLLDPKDYMLIMQKQKDGYKRLSNYAKNFDAKYKIGMEQVQSGAASNLQEYFQTTGFSFGNTKNKKLWSDPATGELILVEMMKNEKYDSNDKDSKEFVMPNRNDNPENFATPAQMLQMIDFTEKSQDLNEDVKNLVTNNLAEVVSSTMTSYNVLSGGKDIKSIEDFRQLFGDVGGLKDENGKKLTFEGWMDIQADGILSDDNTGAEYLMNSNSKYKFTNDKSAADKDSNLIYANTDGGQPVVKLTDAQKKLAKTLVSNQINTQLDFIVKEKAGLGGAQQNQGGRDATEEIDKTAGYIKDLNTVLTGDTATARLALKGMIETRNKQNTANNQATIDGFDMTKDYIVFYMSDGKNIKRERGTFDDPDTAKDESSATSMSQDIASVYDILVPGAQGIKTGLSDNEIFDFITNQKITLGERNEGFGIGEDLKSPKSIGAQTSQEMLDGTRGTITSIVDSEIGGYVDAVDSDNQVVAAVEKSFTSFQSKSARNNFEKAGMKDFTFRKDNNNVYINYKLDGVDKVLKVGNTIAENNTTKENIAAAIATAINDLNKEAYDVATKKGGQRGTRLLFKDWAAQNPRNAGESYPDYTKRYYASYKL
tara:strand:+ start:24136 stop:26220 length:2085 start_codon:yes stop_codon:yes gene_type:complete